jgi:hypothetical protein
LKKNGVKALCLSHHGIDDCLPCAILKDAIRQ